MIKNTGQRCQMVPLVDRSLLPRRICDYLLQNMVFG